MHKDNADSWQRLEWSVQLVEQTNLEDRKSPAKMAQLEGGKSLIARYIMPSKREEEDEEEKEKKLGKIPRIEIGRAHV